MDDNLQRIINWTKIKVRIQHKDVIKYFKEREVWWTSLGANIGYEQDGKHANFQRPVLIIRKFNHDVFIGVPLTSKVKNGRFYEKISLKSGDSSVILSQIRLLSSKRLVRKMQTMSNNEFSLVKDRLKSLL